MNIPNGMTEDEVVRQLSTSVTKLPQDILFMVTQLRILNKNLLLFAWKPYIDMMKVALWKTSCPLISPIDSKTSLETTIISTNSSEDRIKLIKPAQLEYENSIVDQENPYSISYDDIETKNIADLINKYLPADIRMDYLKMINDIYITKQKRDDIVFLINEILQEYGYNEEG